MGDRESEIGDREGAPATRVRSYRDLRVWREAMDVAEATHRLARRLPDDERFGLKTQLRRAAVSVPSNIAEGWGRGATREYVQFLRYARGSLCEVETQLLLAVRCHYLDEESVADVLPHADDLGRMLLGLIRSLCAR